MIQDILPGPVVAEHRFDDVAAPPAFPEEEAVVARAVEERRREFAATRACARAALTRLGVAPGPIPSGRRGAPEWPAGVVGSLTHCDGYRAAAVAWRADIAALGIDAELDQPLPDGVLDMVSLPEERSALRALPNESGVCWDQLLFSVKESVFKAWYPITHQELGFREAVVSFTPATRTFEVRLRRTDDPFGGVLTGAWLRRGGLLVSAIAVAAPPS